LKEDEIVAIAPSRETEGEGLDFQDVVFAEDRQYPMGETVERGGQGGRAVCDGGAF